MKCRNCLPPLTMLSLSRSQLEVVLRLCLKAGYDSAQKTRRNKWPPMPVPPNPTPPFERKEPADAGAFAKLVTEAPSMSMRFKMRHPVCCLPCSPPFQSASAIFESELNPGFPKTYSLSRRFSQSCYSSTAASQSRPVLRRQSIHVTHSMKSSLLIVFGIQQRAQISLRLISRVRHVSI
jgi:hypothetical protein